jgi:hypothetical protein
MDTLSRISLTLANADHIRKLPNPGWKWQGFPHRFCFMTLTGAACIREYAVTRGRVNLRGGDESILRITVANRLNLQRCCYRRFDTTALPGHFPTGEQRLKPWMAAGAYSPFFAAGTGRPTWRRGNLNQGSLYIPDYIATIGERGMLIQMNNRGHTALED